MVKEQMMHLDKAIMQAAGLCRANEAGLSSSSHSVDLTWLDCSSCATDFSNASPSPPARVRLPSGLSSVMLQERRRLPGPS